MPYRQPAYRILVDGPALQHREGLTMTTADLFDGFDAATVDSITRGQQAQQQATGQARAVRTKSRIQTRRATAEKHLASILPARFERGDSWHVMSHGDIDSLSYLRHALAGVSHFDHVLMSTWCIAKAVIVKKVAPFEAERDELVAATQPKERALSQKIKELRGPLYDIDVEIAVLTKALR